MKNFPNIPFIAIAFIAIGIDFLLDRVGNIYTEWYQVLGVICSIHGLMYIIYAFRDEKYGKLFWTFFYISLGAICFYWNQIDYFTWQTIGDYISFYWPVILIFLGIWMIIKSFRKKQKLNQTDWEKSENPNA